MFETGFFVCIHVSAFLHAKRINCFTLQLVSAVQGIYHLQSAIYYEYAHICVWHTHMGHMYTYTHCKV